jgi:hypothetical protein
MIYMVYLFVAWLASADRADKLTELTVSESESACDYAEGACLLQKNSFMERFDAKASNLAGSLQRVTGEVDCSTPDSDADRTICRQCTEGVSNEGVDFNYFEGGRPLVTVASTGSTTCAHFCNADSACGVGREYRAGTDCRMCSPAPSACPEVCLTCASAHGEEFNPDSSYPGVGVYLNQYFVCTNWCGEDNKCGTGAYFADPASPAHAAAVDCAACAGSRFPAAEAETTEDESTTEDEGCQTCKTCAEGPANVGGVALQGGVCLGYCVDGFCLAEDDDGVDCSACLNLDV